MVYRSTNGIDHRTVRPAVVIQRMVDAQIAGVLFTANQVSGRRRQAVIDASHGLWEAVVSGAVNPDHFVVDTASDHILIWQLGDRRVVIRARPGGGTEHTAGLSGANAACLTDDQIRAIAALGDRIEAHYGAPQSCRVAIDSDAVLWLTPARPITTLFPLPSTASPPGDDVRVYICFSLVQGLHRPITPMGLAGCRVLSSSVLKLIGFPVADSLTGASRYAEAGQHLFADVTGVLRSRVGRTLMPRVLDVMEARSAVVLRHVSEDPRLLLTQRSWLPFVRRVLRIATRYRLAVTAGRALVRPDAAQRHARRVGLELGERLTVPETATAAQRLDFAERVLLDECVPLIPRIIPAAAVGLALFGLACKLLGDATVTEQLQTVMRGLPHNVTTEMDLEL